MLGSAAETAKMYVQAVEGDVSGNVFQAWGGVP